MPLFYFDTDDGQHLIEDDEGLDLYSLHEARHRAQAALADMARDTVPGDGPHRTMTCRVRDESGKVALVASLVLMIRRTPEPGKACTDLSLLCFNASYCPILSLSVSVQRAHSVFGERRQMGD